MNLYKYYPVASDRMGIIWTLCTIKDVCIIEFGPAGTTHYAIEGIGTLNADDLCTLYSTHMDQSDITFGSYKRIENCIREVDVNVKPKYIFIMASSVSSIIGADIESVCMELENEVNAKLIPITTGGLKDDYNAGVEEALELIAKNMIKTPDEKKDTYNIIGSTADCYNFMQDSVEVKRMMKEVFNKDLNTIFTAYTSVDEIEKASEASLNIVLRKEGLKVAKFMEKKYNIPYVYKKPIGLTQTLAWINEISELMKYEINKERVEEEEKLIKKYLFRLRFKIRSLENKDVAIFGDRDTVVSMKDFISELGLNVSRAEVLHGVKEKLDDIIVNSSEMEREQFLRDNKLFMLLADGVSIDMKHESPIELQISNPNIDKVNIYPYTPFVGFRGCLYLLEKILSA